MNKVTFINKVTLIYGIHMLLLLFLFGGDLSSHPGT